MYISSNLYRIRQPLAAALRRGFASSAQRSKTSGAGGGGGLAMAKLGPEWNPEKKGPFLATKMGVSINGVPQNGWFIVKIPLKWMT